MKQIILRALKELGLSDELLQEISNTNQVCLFEEGYAYLVNKTSFLYAIKTRLEDNGKNQVYGITHEFTDAGELYDFLMSTQEDETKEDVLYPLSSGSRAAFAYVHNKTNIELSEFGEVSVKYKNGGLIRSDIYRPSLNQDLEGECQTWQP